MRIFPLISKKKWVPTKTWVKQLPNQQIFFHFSRKSNQRMRFPYSNNQIDSPVQESLTWDNNRTGKTEEPINDWISWWVTLCVQRKVERRSRHLSSFSCGKWAPMRTVTSSMPAKAWVVDGPIVPWLCPENYVTLKKVPYWCWHASFEGEIIKKSSNKCKI